MERCLSLCVFASLLSIEDETRARWPRRRIEWIEGKELFEVFNKICLLVFVWVYLLALSEQGWRGNENTNLAWVRFWTRISMWVEFVGSLFCSEVFRCGSGVLWFSHLTTNHNLIWSRQIVNQVSWAKITQSYIHFCPLGNTYKGFNPQNLVY